MVDIKFIRAEPETAVRKLESRGVKDAEILIAYVLVLDEEHRFWLGMAEKTKALHNEYSRLIGKLKAA